MVHVLITLPEQKIFVLIGKGTTLVVPLSRRWRSATLAAEGRLRCTERNASQALKRNSKETKTFRHEQNTSPSRTAVATFIDQRAEINEPTYKPKRRRATLDRTAEGGCPYITKNSLLCCFLHHDYAICGDVMQRLHDS
jgi:hypothetical protein